MQRIIDTVRKNPVTTSLIIFYCLTVIFRIWFMAHHFSFGQDVARDVQYMKILAAHHTILVGYGPKASVGNFYLPPFYYQLHYFFSLITNHNPVTMYIVTILIESFTPILLFFITKRLVETKIALALSILYSLFSVAITASTSAWNPHMIPFLSTLALFSWLKVMEDKHHQYIVIGSLAITLAFHLHYQAAVLLPFAFIIFVWTTIIDRHSLRYWLIAIAISLLTFAPYIYAEAQNHWQNTQSIINFFAHVHSQYYDRVSKPAFVFSFIPSFIERITMGNELPYLLVGRAIFLLGLLIMSIESTQKKTVRLLFIYFISILIMLRIYKGDKNDFYMSILYIMPLMLLTIMYSKLRYLVIVLAVIISFFSGKAIAAIKPFNDLTQLKVIVTSLNQAAPSNKIQLIFHDTHYINLFIYGISQYGQFTIDQRSPMLMDICNADQICNWTTEASCRISRSYSYSQYVKAVGAYQKITDIQLFPYHVILGKLNNTTHLPTIQSKFDYGTDVLMPELQINP